jgi:hypothetical protein
LVVLTLKAVELCAKVFRVAQLCAEGIGTWTKAFWVAQTGNEGCEKGKQKGKKESFIGSNFGRAARPSIFM